VAKTGFKMTEDKLSIKDEMTEFLLYTTPEGEVKVEIFLHDETIWLTQKGIGCLFGKSRTCGSHPFIFAGKKKTQPFG